ncbi:TonB-dependent receptor [Aliidiomarina iranensis]|uniref:TonB-dependent receptor n=1 Tax=Aliidiomarina iranensis TaxID=1434071 RepID=A0A432VZZ7_9GAMM|nr:TonB-dependent receptor [Aliidiomarina iranensis]RUO22315.1 TonB-dependent receptor [Aliidiomarina iranensis]
MFTNNKISKSVRLALAFGAASTLAFAGSVSAQEDEDEEEVESDRPERIQVVGSRIRTDGLDSATPIDIISAELATEQGLNTLGELLRTATIATGSNQLIASQSVGAVTPGGAGAESISMRGLGANRTLVLLNGRRAGPAGTRGQVSAFDMNALPVSAVERVEILKDGASSLYGSDAVAGVINIITKRGDESAINVSGSQPLETGGENFRVNGTWGKSFDRGSFRLVADYNLQTELQRGDRDHYECGQRYVFSPETGQQVDPVDPRTGNPHCNDLPYGMWLWDAGAPNYLSQVTYFDHTGYFADNPVPVYEQTQVGDIAAPEGWFPAGYDRPSDAWINSDHPFQYLETMIPETEVTSVFMQGDYDLSDTISMYAELLHSRRETTTNGYRQFWEPFIPAWIGLVDGWDGYVYLDPTAVTDHSGNVTTVDYSRAVLGFEGSLGYWNWDVSYQRTVNSGEYQQKIILDDALVMAANAVWGDPCEGEFSPISNRPCYAIDFFTPDYIFGNFDQGTRDFLFDTETGKTIYKQDTLDAYITGDLYDLPAGTLATAIGFSYQTDEIQDTPGEMTLQGNSWGMTSSGITAGKSNTKAVYAEINAPLLRDLPFIEALDVTGSVRHTDVSTYGTGDTFKLSSNWTIGNGFRLRASRGTSFRSPALYELFLQDQTSFFQQTSDPCFDWAERLDAGTLNPIAAANCQSDGIPADYASNYGSATAITRGGAGTLEAETSVSEGIGLVWSSEDDRFAGSVDYYDVTIRNQINNLSGPDILSLCYNSENFETEPYCNQFDRNDGGEAGDNFNIVETYGGYENIAEQRVRGADVVFTYMDETRFGGLRVRLDHTIQFERSVKRLPNSENINSVGRLGSPKHSGTLNIGLVRDALSFNYALRYVSKVSNDSLYTNGAFGTYRGEEVRFVASAPTTVYHTFSVNREFGDGVDLTFGVNNLFDKKPPKGSPSRAYVTGNAMMYSQYDQIGRRVFFNLGYTF